MANIPQIVAKNLKGNFAVLLMVRIVIFACLLFSVKVNFVAMYVL